MKTKLRLQAYRAYPQLFVRLLLMPWPPVRASGSGFLAALSRFGGGFLKFPRKAARERPLVCASWRDIVRLTSGNTAPSFVQSGSFQIVQTRLALKLRLAIQVRDFANCADWREVYCGYVMNFSLIASRRSSKRRVFR